MNSNAYVAPSWRTVPSRISFLTTTCEAVLGESLVLGKKVAVWRFHPRVAHAVSHRSVLERRAQLPLLRVRTQTSHNLLRLQVPHHRACR
ncbi:hypothetical protein EKPV-NSW-ORF098 [Eastern grey kangaroopox virus]|uniref:Uncharacterized protein n=1 Tax=Eastern grey kangaroopox virus TaxID=2042482 RepID=A0A345Z0Q6_9POXV|nr:hypothetical protein EKPV-NSW-ORF098 [Eastern grey kangaroopox virus]